MRYLLAGLLILLTGCATTGSVTYTSEITNNRFNDVWNPLPDQSVGTGSKVWGGNYRRQNVPLNLRIEKGDQSATILSIQDYVNRRGQIIPVVVFTADSTLFPKLNVTININGNTHTISPENAQVIRSNRGTDVFLLAQVTSPDLPIEKASSAAPRGAGFYRSRTDLKITVRSSAHAAGTYLHTFDTIPDIPLFGTLIRNPATGEENRVSFVAPDNNTILTYTNFVKPDTVYEILPTATITISW